MTTATAERPAAPEPPGADTEAAPTRILLAVTAFVPGAAVVFLSFNGGGFFPGAPALVAVVLALLLVLQVTLLPEPFAGLSRLGAVAILAMGLFTAWTLVSVLWSDSAERAILEFSRNLGYLLALVLFATPAAPHGRVALIVRGLVAGIVVVCGIGLISRILPEVWPIRPGYVDERLSYPITYWNAFGILAAVGIVLAFHLAASVREPRVVRVLGAGVVPALAAALFFSFSRGSFGAAVIGLVVYALLARPRGLLPALVATGPATALAISAAYGAEVLSSEAFAGAAGVAEGRDVARTLAIATVAALALRAATLPLDAKLAALEIPRAVTRATAAVGVLAAIGAALALGLPGYAERQYERFKEPLPPNLENRDRFFVPSNNDRLAIWRIAEDEFASERVRGTGAGTFELSYAANRPEGLAPVRDGHSLYLETLAELGIVGGALLFCTLLALLAGAARRARGPGRAVFAALVAAGLAWGLHAAIDWDWEMPATTLWLFAAGGAALASGSGRPLVPARAVRVGLALGVLVLAVTPFLVARSQARLDAAVRAFQQGDCRTAIDESLSSLEALNVRTGPFVVLGYCDARLGLPELSVQAMEQAVDRDPRNWQTYYGLAVARGAAGLDPRPAARRALALNPSQPLAIEAAEAFGSTDNPRAWERRARRARLPEL